MSSEEEVIYKKCPTTGEFIEVRKQVIPHLPEVAHSQDITAEKIREFLPKKYSGVVSDSIIQEIQRIEQDTGLPQNHMEEAIMGNLNLLGGTGKTLKDLVDAQKYCALREAYGNNKKAFLITFPEKAKKFKENGQTPDSHVSMYHGRQIVQDVLKTMAIATCYSLQPQRMAAIQVQLNLMNGIGAKEDDRVSPTVQQLASAKIIEMTELPEDNTIELKMGLSDDAMSMQQSVVDQLSVNAKLMREAFAKGKSLDDIQRLRVVVNAEAVEDE